MTGAEAHNSRESLLIVGETASSVQSLGLGDYLTLNHDNIKVTHLSSGDGY